MRIAAISDIHIRPDGSDTGLLEEIHKQVEEISPDVFIIAGDISDKIRVIEETLSMLQIAGSKNLYVAGNHDVWFEDELGLNSLEKYSKSIGNACEKAGFIHLPDTPIIIDEFAFVGSLGWYDYSFRQPELEIPEDTYAEKHWQEYYWRDYYSIDWSYSDYEFTELLNSKLQYDLDTLPGVVKSIVYVSHHLPFQALTLYKNTLPWDFFSAFMGAESTGQILLNDERIKLSVSGHSHIRKLVSIGNLTAITVPVGYGRPANNEYSSLVHDGLAVLDLSHDGCDFQNYVEGDICEGLPYIF